jgi:hypothetical protein
MPEFTCPKCSNRVQAADTLAGKHVLCPNCNATMSALVSHVDAAITGTAPLPRTSTDGAFAEGLPPMEPLRPVHKKAPPLLGRYVPLALIGSVVIVAIGLLIIAVQKVRETAARTQSTNNLKQIIGKFLAFHDVHKRIPFNGARPARASDPTSGSWAFQITPFEQTDFFDKPNTTTGFPDYICPGRGRPSVCTTGAWSDYCINPWLNDPDGRVDAPDAKRTLVSVTDGISNTIFVGQGSIDPAMYSATEAFAQSTDVLKGGQAATARRSTLLFPDRRGNADLTWGGPFGSGLLVGMGDMTVRAFAYDVPTCGITNGIADGFPARFIGNEPIPEGGPPEGVVWTFGTYLTPTGGEALTVPH